MAPKSGPRQDSTRILNYMSKANQDKFGVVFYRCCSYGDDARWCAFMDRMKGWAISGLEREVDGIAIKDKLSLETVEDPELVEASKDEIRRRHKEWVAASGEPVNRGMNTRHHYPIYVDEASLNSVLNGCEPGKMTFEELHDPTAYVILIDMFFNIPEATEEDIADGVDPADDGCSPIDGCKMEDVGWMKMKPYDLIPRGYSFMMNFGWSASYRRPPQFADIG